MDNQDFQGDYDLFLDSDDSGYDALADFDDGGEEYDESSGQGGPILQNQTSMYYAPKQDDLTPEQKIDELFERLAPRRRVLLGILEYVKTPQRADALKQKVEELQTYDASVYDGYDFSRLLHRAEAISKVAEDGSEYDENAEQEPDIVEVDGEQFYKPTDGKQVFWLITEAGQAYLDKDDPYGRLSDLLGKEPEYLHIYKDVLEFCGSAGRSAEELKTRIEADPVTKKPHRFSTYFVKRLEDAGALIWRGAWHITEVGQKGLDSLFGNVVVADGGTEVKGE